MEASKVCQDCLVYGGSWCSLYGKRVAYNRVGCGAWDDGQPRVVRLVEVPKVRDRKRPPSEEQVRVILEIYDRGGAISSAAKTGKVGWATAMGVIETHRELGMEASARVR